MPADGRKPVPIVYQQNPVAQRHVRFADDGVMPAVAAARPAPPLLPTWPRTMCNALLRLFVIVLIVNAWASQVDLVNIVVVRAACCVVPVAVIACWAWFARSIVAAIRTPLAPPPPVDFVPAAIGWW